MQAPRPQCLLVLAALVVTGCALERSGLGSDGQVPAPDAALDAGDLVRDADVLDAPTGADAGRAWVVDYDDATFARGSEGSYLVGAPSAAGGFLRWAPADTARLEDRGDGAGPLLLVEGARENLLTESRASSSASWALTGTGGLVITEDVAAGPDGEMRAERYTGSGYSRGQSTGASSSSHTLSAWGRAETGTSVWTANFAYPAQPFGYAWFVAVQDEVWARRSSTVTPTTNANYHPIDLTLGGGTLQLFLDLHQIEQARFPSSVIRTGPARASRGADVVTIAVADVPVELTSGRGGFVQVSPVFASDDLAPGDEMWLLSLGGAAQGVRLRRDGADVVIEIVEDGTVRARSASLTFARHGLLGAVCWDPTAGTVTVGGTTGPTGTAWSWDASQVRVGGVVSGGSEAFARLGALGGC